MVAFGLKCIVYFISVFPLNFGFAQEDDEYLEFPPDFVFGVATSAYQYEGAWNVSDKAESVWDRFVHEKRDRVSNNDTADDACKSYYKYKEDVALAKTIGFDYYRFSISWARILPQGFIHKISQDGIKYYHDLIDEIIRNDLVPVVTIYHWDHPQILEDAGGWTNPNMVNWYEDFARIVFREFSSKVKFFITVNEPGCYCIYSYVYGYHAPGKTQLPGVGEYWCLHNLLKAHAKAYRLYEKEYKDQYNGLVGINLHMVGLYPKYPNETASSERAFQFTVGWVLNPIFSKKGDYPELMKRNIAKLSKKQGFTRSRLPTFSPNWVKYLRGTSDFLGINHYTSRLVQASKKGEMPPPSYYNDWQIQRSTDPSWKTLRPYWLQVFAKGFGDGLRRIAKAYDNPMIFITENGVGTGDELEDDERVHFYQEYLTEMLIAINRDGVNIKGFLAWSLLDNFEWDGGYADRFGLVHVNFTDPEKKRTLKKSAYWWQDLINTRRLPQISTCNDSCGDESSDETCDILI